MPEFKGFSLATRDFLLELEANNNRDWFAEHKPRYEAEVLEPALDYIATMQEPLAGLSEHFRAIPKRMGGSLMRVYRDTRFGKDKRPYKTNIGIQFRHEQGKDVHAPGYYLHLAEDGCFLGVGLWRPESGALAGIRDRIAFRPKEWQRASRSRPFTSRFTFGGESLKRPPRGYTADHPQIEDLKRKDFIAAMDFDFERAMKPNFVKWSTDQWRAATPLMAFLCAAVEVPF
ncbi:MAG: DUF2461 domain-containing protein [Pseudomonadota bacterium]